MQGRVLKILGALRSFLEVRKKPFAMTTKHEELAAK